MLLLTWIMHKFSGIFAYCSLENFKKGCYSELVEEFSELVACPPQANRCYAQTDIFAKLLFA